MVSKSSKPERRRSPRAEPSQPEITLRRGPVGRETLAAITEDLARETEEVARPRQDTVGYEQRPAMRAPGFARSSPAPAEIFEVSTFVVQGDEIFSKVSELSRREFVERRLLHRLPVLSMNDVVRIDVSRGAAAETVILRVWSKVGDPRR